MQLKIRNEKPSDAGEIDAVIATAFKNAAHTSHTEHFIVKALRAAGKLSVSLVAENECIIGHVAVSPITVDGRDIDWYGLGPISVHPAYQQQGIGSALMEGALAELRNINAAGCVVLGEPAYYSRFGFKAEAGLILPEVPPAYFQALAFRAPLPAGIVAYDEAFNAQS